jgi:PAT family acetyl-CoA transporter-like MFS transporter 1
MYNNFQYRYGLTRDTLALLRIPLLAIHIGIPLCLNRTRCPLKWFSRGYILHSIGSLLLGIYIFYMPQIVHTLYFYPVLILLLCLNECFLFLKISSCVGFYARISEPRIAGTYMTLLATISSLGYNLLSTLGLYIASQLPKSYAYFIEVGICFILGLIWIRLTWNTLKRLDGLPVEEWYLKDSSTTNYHLITQQD